MSIGWPNLGGAPLMILAGMFRVIVPLWPVGAAFGPAAVFRYGTRLQKDTEGLV